MYCSFGSFFSCFFSSTSTNSVYHHNRAGARGAIHEHFIDKLVNLKFLSPCDGIVDLDVSTMSSRTGMPVSALEKSSTAGTTLPIEYLSF